MKNLASSFRDPDGFLFENEGELYRCVRSSYREDYEALWRSGLYERLIQKGRLVAHQELTSPDEFMPDAYKILKPERIPFISYPYEWCFGQLKDAALLTLDILKEALDCGMTLKDASAYNVQFRSGKPIFIDSLSFERYVPGRPWTAYRQFCQHFLAPLALMSRKGTLLSNLSKHFLDGIPLDLAASLLPWSTRFEPALLMHVHLHAAAQRAVSKGSRDDANRAGTFRPNMNLNAMFGLVDSLRSALQQLRSRDERSHWRGYYQEGTYSPAAACSKKEIVNQFLDAVKPCMVWDFGANTGLYSRLASDRGSVVISMDSDPACVQSNYEQIPERGASLLPLCIDITNPSPRLGWNGAERQSLDDRGPADLVMALALVHHLFISHHLPWKQIAEWFARCGKNLLIEFIPKTDPAAQKIWYERKDKCSSYTQECFEVDFNDYFSIEERVPVRDSVRILYRMRRRS